MMKNRKPAQERPDTTTGGLGLHLPGADCSNVSGFCNAAAEHKNILMVMDRESALREQEGM